MAVVLHVVEPNFDGPLMEPFDVPDGSIVTIRRHAQGADVIVAPRAGNAANEKDRAVASFEAMRGEDEEVRIAVRGFKVERSRPGCAELVAEDGGGARYRLFLGGAMEGWLADCLRGGEPAAQANSHEAALARRATAEAQLVELEVTEKTRAARAHDRSVEASRLWVEFNADVGRASICAADHHGGPETKIEVSPDQILCLLEQLLHARRSLDKAGA